MSNSQQRLWLSLSGHWPLLTGFSYGAFGEQQMLGAAANTPLSMALKFQPSSSHAPNPPNLVVVLSSGLPRLYPLYVTAGNATPQTIDKLLAAYRQAQQDSVRMQWNEFVLVEELTESSGTVIMGTSETRDVAHGIVILPVAIDNVYNVHCVNITSGCTYDTEADRLVLSCIVLCNHTLGQFSRRLLFNCSDISIREKQRADVIKLCRLNSTEEIHSRVLVDLFVPHVLNKQVYVCLGAGRVVIRRSVVAVMLAALVSFSEG
ncbi:hypothetical protein MCOR27_006421 [Pyricularia oryzae]|uniref:Uncharacterized protein n=1 Tax=Pyricularia oryzae TaxID=318829 RepID=A0A4P7N0R3_PYROR|nr:hypothetical protein MCOR19_004731 [Pyricularia oryzae]KAI6276526.1 hypothetical protein MCOR27_006421 [Pyricularia oryzae]KAI6364536.1 hypothetical protein MCOR31_007363 [Pyricularia oryzae]KAI6424863.1 hypothetical protein MCOR24_003223 [Pyricularia oryzae]KAI6644254.1 hypothetical protein MCOR14_001370 [Pyricularia oryzae]